jgi:hypothetical protein
MSKFQKKPVVIEAVQFNGSNHREVMSFVYPDLSEDAIAGAETMRLPVVIETLEGDMTASPGDWVIKGVKGEFYPCKPDIFAATYSECGEAPVSNIPPHQQRVIAEKAELDDKATKLSHFIGTNPIFENLDAAEQERLKEQCEIMWQYSEILGKRIAAFNLN